MPSMIVAAGLMALSGMAAAFPQGGFSNGTTGAVGGNSTATAPRPLTTGSSSDPVTEALFCPNLSGSIIQSKTGVSEFLLSCSTNHFGVVIDVTFNSTAFVNKRQAAVAPANIQDCIAACDTVSACVGTAFDSAARTCALYSEVGVAYPANGIDFAIRVAGGPATTATAGQPLTSTVYSTQVQTISSCAPTVTNCPLTKGLAGPVVVTQVVAVSSTEYICPAPTVLPVAPVACACAYGASTVTVYSVSGTAAVSVSTSVVAVPSPSMAAFSATTVVGTAAITTAPGANGGSATATTSKPAAFTGAASNVKAGMGLVAGVAGLAFML